MDKNKEKAFDFAAESTKQLITLSTAIIALTVTFSKDVVGSIDNNAKFWLALTWIAFILSVVFGIWTMLALTGTLDPMTRTSASNTPAPNTQQANFSINGKNIRIASILQIFLFLVGLVFSMVFGFKSISKGATENPTGYKILRQTTFGVDTTIYKDTIVIPTK